MSEPFVGEIRCFGFSFVPRGWASCDGSLLQTAQNTALFSVLGTTFGGDGQSTFALPDLRGRTPIHADAVRALGLTGGAEMVALTEAELPLHTHELLGSAGQATSTSPSGLMPADAGQNVYAAPTPNPVEMRAGAAATAGGSVPHNNQQPSLVLNWCIATVGTFPTEA